MEPHRPTNARNLAEVARSVDSRYPGAAYLGLAFWLAWSRVACPALWGSAESWAALPLNGSHSLCIHVVPSAVIAAVIVATALFETRLAPLLGTRGFLVGSGLLSCAGTAGLLICSVLSLPIAPFALFCAAAGGGMGALLVRCLLLYGDLAPQRILLLAAASWGISFVVDILFRTMPLVAAVPVFCSLPLVAAALFSLHNLGAGTSTPATAPSPDVPLSPSKPFWQFVLTVFLVALVSEMVVYFNSYDETVRLASMSGAGALVVGICVILVAYAAAFPQSYIFSRLYYPTIFAIMALLGLLLIFPSGASWSLTASLAACQLFSLLVWCLFGCTVAQSKASSLKVFGYGYGIQLLGTVLGYVLGSRIDAILGSRQIGLLSVYVVAAIIALALSLAIYPPRTMHDLLLAIPDDDAPERRPAAEATELERICARLADERSLTVREREVMVLLARGRGSTYISENLGVTLSTVYTHTRNLYRKLGVHSREELMHLVDTHIEGKHPHPSA